MIDVKNSLQIISANQSIWKYLKNIKAIFFITSYYNYKWFLLICKVVVTTSYDVMNYEFNKALQLYRFPISLFCFWVSKPQRYEWLNINAIMTFQFRAILLISIFVTCIALNFMSYMIKFDIQTRFSISNKFVKKLRIHKIITSYD